MARTNTVYFTGCNTMEDLTARLMALIAENGSDAEKVTAISQEYDTLFISFKKKANKGKEKWQKVKDNPEKLRNIAMTLLTYKDAEKDLDFRRDCVLELRGRWFYVYAKEGKDTEITRKYRELLNREGLGFIFSKRLGQWFWYDGVEKSKYHHKGTMTADESREKHGSRIIDTEEEV